MQDDLFCWKQSTMFPVLETERLQLRQVQQSDAPVVLKGYSDPLVNQHMSVEYYSLEEVQTQLDWYSEIYRTGEGIWWAFCKKENPAFVIGNGGFHNYKPAHKCIELGYWILPDEQGKGYASEVIPAVCKYAFQAMDVHRIEAIVEGGNLASIQLLHKLGFTNEGARKECELKNGRFIDLYSFALFNPAH
jgi:ribosomal-protein-alanine N-acetyltransferase